MFLSPNQLSDIEQQVMNELINNKVYISTDSSTMLKRIYHKTYISIYFMNDYSRWHSSYSNTDNRSSIMMGSIIDLGVLSLSRKIFITRWSSYGDLACTLSKSSCHHIAPQEYPFIHKL